MHVKENRIHSPGARPLLICPRAIGRHYHSRGTRSFTPGCPLSTIQRHPRAEARVIVCIGWAPGLRFAIRRRDGGSRRCSPGIHLHVRFRDLLSESSSQTQNTGRASSWEPHRQSLSPGQAVALGRYSLPLPAD